MSLTTKRWASLGALAVTAALVAGACNSGTPSPAPASTAASQAPAPSTAASQEAAASTAPSQAQTGSTGKGANIFVVGGKPDDPFWSKVKKGVDDAAKVVESYGGKVTYLGPANYDNLGPDAAKLLQTALSQNPTGVVGADWVPDAQDAAFKAITAAGIPVILYGAGLNQYKSVGAMNYIGSDDHAAGVTSGEYFAEHGAKNVLCIDTLPGTTVSQERCGGLSEGIGKSGGKATDFPLPSSQFGDPTAIAQAVKAALLKDSTIDGVFTLGSQDATSAASGIEQAGATGKVKLGGVDLDSDALQRIKAGTQLFLVDQQPYLWGAFSVELLNDYYLFGNDLPTKPLMTGPSVVVSSNVDAVIAGAAAGAR